MALLDAKCPNCGAVLKVDGSKDAAICEHCGSAFIVEKAVNNYVTNVTNNFANATVFLNDEFSKDCQLAAKEKAIKNTRKITILQDLNEKEIFRETLISLTSVPDSFYDLIKNAHFYAPKLVTIEFVSTSIFTHLDYTVSIGYNAFNGMDWKPMAGSSDEKGYGVSFISAPDAVDRKYLKDFTNQVFDYAMSKDRAEVMDEIVDGAKLSGFISAAIQDAELDAAGRIGDGLTGDDYNGLRYKAKTLLKNVCVVKTQALHITYSYRDETYSWLTFDGNGALYKPKDFDVDAMAVACAEKRWETCKVVGFAISAVCFTAFLAVILGTGSGWSILLIVLIPAYWLAQFMVRTAIGKHDREKMRRGIFINKIKALSQILEKNGMRPLTDKEKREIAASIK